MKKILKQLLDGWLLVFWWVGAWGLMSSIINKFNLTHNKRILTYFIITMIPLIINYAQNQSFNLIV